MLFLQRVFARDRLWILLTLILAACVGQAPAVHASHHQNNIRCSCSGNCHRFLSTRDRGACIHNPCSNRPT